jgi:hypothetical protein
MPIMYVPFADVSVCLCLHFDDESSNGNNCQTWSGVLMWLSRIGDAYAHILIVFQPFCMAFQWFYALACSKALGATLSQGLHAHFE